MKSIPSSWRNCCTCEFWAGSRRPSAFRNMSEYVIYTKGECAGGGYNRAMMDGLSSCGRWKKWGVLK